MKVILVLCLCSTLGYTLFGASNSNNSNNHFTQKLKNALQQFCDSTKHNSEKINDLVQKTGLSIIIRRSSPREATKIFFSTHTTLREYIAQASQIKSKRAQHKIKRGHVSVDDKTITDPNYVVSTEQIVFVNKKFIQIPMCTFMPKKDSIDTFIKSNNGQRLIREMNRKNAIKKQQKNELKEELVNALARYFSSYDTTNLERIHNRYGISPMPMIRATNNNQDGIMLGKNKRILTFVIKHCNSEKKIKKQCIKILSSDNGKTFLDMIVTPKQ